MSVCFYPQHEFACPNLSHCPHLGGMALGSLVVIANRCDQSFESSRLTIRGLEERNAMRKSSCRRTAIVGRQSLGQSGKSFFLTTLAVCSL